LSGSFIGGPIVNDDENANAIDALQRRLIENPNVMPFIGSGFSRPFGYPGWVEFLHDGANLVGRQAEIDDLALQGDYESAMSVIRRELEGINYFDFLRNTFGPRKAGALTWNAPVRFLPAMPKNPIVSTNIDGVLEQVFEEHGLQLEVIVGARRDRIRVAIEEKQRCLIKLHGDYRDQADQILTLEDYERHYGHGSRAARKHDPFLGIVQNLLAGNSFLFLGFGMEERTKKLLKSVAEGGGLHSHWIVLPRSSRAADRARAKELGRSNVRTLWYDEEHHEHIGAFLHWATYTAAPGDSPLRRFYSAIERGAYWAALAPGEEALIGGFRDPELSWNVSAATELAARELLGEGRLAEGMQLLGKSVASHEHAAESAVALKWAISYALDLTPVKKPAKVAASTLEILSLIREAVNNPNPSLLSGNSYQLASSNGIAEALRTLCLLQQDDENSIEAVSRDSIEIVSRDSLVGEARNAALSQRMYSARAAGAEGLLRGLKKAYYLWRASQEESKFNEARRAFAGRQIVLLKDLNVRRRWYDEY
jgi:hypothetical protein